MSDDLLTMGLKGMTNSQLDEMITRHREKIKFLTKIADKALAELSSRPEGYKPVCYD